MLAWRCPFESAIGGISMQGLSEKLILNPSSAKYIIMIVDSSGLRLALHTNCVQNGANE